VTGALASIVEASPLSAQQKLAPCESRFDGLRRVAEGQAPFRLSGMRFTVSRMRCGVASAEERAAEGITWGDSESNSDDVQRPVLFGNGSVA
jgi:hypothetical protein